MANRLSAGGDGNADSGMADAQFLALFITAFHRVFPEALDGGGRAVLSGAGGKGGCDCPECPCGAESPPGGPYYEEVLMRKETSSGGHLERFCPLIIAIM